MSNMEVGSSAAFLITALSSSLNTSLFNGCVRAATCLCRACGRV